jgi:aldehyde:ferredoxin oxidoreductase
MVKGYANKILKVDLTSGAITVDEPPASFYRRYLGGQGLIAYYLLKELPKGADPLGPDNLLIFADGAFTGVPFAGTGRSSVGGKSPLTGGFGEAEAGGYFGAELKRAGYDAIVVRGKAPEPVTLWIHDGQVEIRPAGHLWGKQVLETHEMLQAELDEHVRTALIGPGGEKQVRFACVMHDVLHAAGRTGLGAVMGSKNLKAVAARGKQKVEAADPEGVKRLAIWMRDHWEEKNKDMHLYGTAGGLGGLNAASVLPTRNFQDGQFEGAEKISGQTMRETLLIDEEGCYACTIRCKRVVKVTNDRYQVDPLYGGPEYETLGAVGSLCGVDDLEAISKANELCNAYSLDTISAGGAVAFAMECFENGLLTLEDTCGLDLRFGNAEAMVEMIRQIGEREGLGDLLAEGPNASIAKIGPGAKQFSIDVKNQYFPMHECRARHGQALGYAVSPTGADHMHNIWDHAVAGDPVGEGAQELGLYEPISPTVLNAQKVRAYMYTMHWTSVHNHLGHCMFLPWSRAQIVEMTSAITGWNSSTWELMKVSERTTTMARLFNLREGLTRADDRLPERIAKPLRSYPGVTPEELQEALTTYYGMMGWDPETGMPTRAKLQELDIEWAGNS